MSFPRRVPNSSLRHVEARDFKRRRTGCLANAARMEQNPCLPGLGRGLRALPARLRWGSELAARQGGGQPFLLSFGNVSLLIQLRKRMSLFRCVRTNFKMRSCFSSLWRMLALRNTALSPISVTKLLCGAGRKDNYCVSLLFSQSMTVCPTWQNIEDFSSIWRTELHDVWLGEPSGMSGRSEQMNSVEKFTLISWFGFF